MDLLSDNMRLGLDCNRNPNSYAYTYPNCDCHSDACHHAKCAWLHGEQQTKSEASSSKVDIYRNGARIVTTTNDGFYADPIGGHGHGTYTYQVCNQGSQTCSNQATVTF